MRHIVKAWMVVTLLLGRPQLVRGGDSMTPAQLDSDLAACRRGGWVIGSPLSPSGAGIDAYHCDGRTTLQLVEYRDAEGTRSETIRARLDIPGTQTILPCAADGPRGARFSNIMFVPVPGNGFLNQKVQRAWKADLDLWELKEIDPTDVRCYFGVSKNDD